MLAAPLRGDADAGVADGDFQGIPIPPERQFNAPVMGELYGVI